MAVWAWLGAGHGCRGALGGGGGQWLLCPGQVYPLGLGAAGLCSQATSSMLLVPAGGVALSLAPGGCRLSVGRGETITSSRESSGSGEGGVGLPGVGRMESRGRLLAPGVVAVESTGTSGEPGASRAHPPSAQDSSADALCPQGETGRQGPGTCVGRFSPRC